MMTSNHEYQSLAEAYFAGQISKDDQRKLDAWLRAETTHVQLFREWEQAWATSAAAKAQTDAAWQRFRQMTAPQPVIKPLWRRPVFYWTAAAVLLLLLALPVIKLTTAPEVGSPELVEGETPEAEEGRLLQIQAAEPMAYYLPDSSLVRLAQGACIAYTSDYATNERAIQLTGEAYFEVAKNPDCHFTVTASDFVVEVTGTHFTVKADSAAATASVELHEGAVQVHYADSTYLLSPGEELTYYKDRQQMRYSRQCLGGLLQRLSRHYHQPIVFEDTPFMQQHVHYTLRPGQALKDILEALCEVYPMEVYERDNTYIVRQHD